MSNINTWPGWKCIKEIGKGSFGSVYEIQKEELGHVYKVALKVISIPADANEVNSMKDLGMDDEKLTTYYQTTIRNISNEFALMASLKGNSNIVSYEDHMVIPRENEFGWDILIRMELLTPLREYMKTHRFEKEDVVKMGIGMCNALEICQKKGILHRDIKPANIFVNDNGDYKLGDFGVSKNLENTQQATTKVGTYHYMAPEIFKGEKYGHVADLYSLAMVMYQYLNGGALPFLSDGSQVENVLSKRMSGAKIPAPQYGDEQINSIVLKCLAYNPSKRYQSAKELRKALQDYQRGIEQPIFVDDEPTIAEPAKRFIYCPHCGNKQPEDALFCGVCGKSMHTTYVQTPVQPPKKNNTMYIVIIVVALAIAGILGFLLLSSGSGGTGSNGDSGNGGTAGPTTCTAADEEYDSTLKKCVKKEEDPKTACTAAGKYWDDDSSTCMTKEEKEKQEEQTAKTACAAKSDYSWNDSTKSCEYDAKKACNAAGKVWDGSTCYTTEEWNLLQQINACTAAGNTWDYTSNTCYTPTKYTAGTYYLVYNDMNIRSGPSKDYPSVKIIKIKEVSSVYISDVSVEKTSSGNKYWGRTSDGWICIEAPGQVYLSK